MMSSMKQWKDSRPDAGFGGLVLEDPVVRSVGEKEVLVKFQASSLNYRGLAIANIRLSGNQDSGMYGHCYHFVCSKEEDHDLGADHVVNYQTTSNGALLFVISLPKSRVLVTSSRSLAWVVSSRA